MEHNWKIFQQVRRKFGKANKCENINCLKNCEKYQWSLKEDKERLLDINNFRMLCVSCGRGIDRKSQKFNEARIEKLRTKILPPNENGCHLWTGHKQDFGYGVVGFKSKLFFSMSYGLNNFKAESASNQPISPISDICSRSV